ncbi:MAG: M1 family aminopeptidase [Bryobacteraceae bacterium]
MRFVAALLVASSLLYAEPSPSAAALAQTLREMSLDPDECYRVRDLRLAKEDARFFFTDGHLIFGKPVEGRPVWAVFSADVEGGDAELLLLPPDKSERRSLAAFTQSPNLNEHFKLAILLFTDQTHRALMEEIQSGVLRKSPETGVLMAEQWSPVVRNISTGFESVLVLDLLSRNPENGLFFAAVSGKKLGNFDVLYDPRSAEQIVVGQTTFRENRTFFDVWTSFTARSFRKQAAPPPEPEVKIKDYRIEAWLDASLQMRVVTKATVTPAGEGRVLPFEVSRQMRITQALVDGVPAEVFQRESMRSNLIRNNNNEVFLVIPPQPLAPGREYQLEFHHEGAVVSQASERLYYVGARGNWYPGRGMQFARYDLTFHYPKELDLVSAGTVVEDQTGEEVRTTRRRIGAPVRWAGFNLGVYERARISRGGLAVEVCGNRREPPRPHVLTGPILLPPPQPFPRRGQPPSSILNIPSTPPPPDPQLRLEHLAGEIASAMEFMAEKLGPPALDSLTVSPIPGAFGQGFPGLIYLSTFAYLQPRQGPLRTMTQRHQEFFSETLHAHEAAHQWWGNLVASGGYRDDWLMEALAQYTALLYLEKRKGGAQLETVLEQYRTDLSATTDGGKTVESAGPIVLGMRLNSSQSPASWRVIIYEKGSWILHMLRRRMGDGQFFRMLGELRRRYERKTVSTEQFRLLAAEFLPKGAPDARLEAFFDQWVYGSGIPSLQLRHSVRGKASGLQLTGTVTQSGVDEDFSVHVPVEIRFASGPPVVHWVRTSYEPVPFTVWLKARPVKVLLDPHYTVLAEKR